MSKKMDFEVELVNESNKKEENPFIVTSSLGNHYEIYITGDIVDTFSYLDELKLLASVTENDKVTIRINSVGGLLATALQFVSAIRACKAPTVALVNEASSAATLISLACGTVIMQPHGFFMIHTYSHGVHAKGSDIKALHEFSEKHIKQIMYDLYLGFLTEDEIEAVISGTDKYYTEDECNMRLARRANTTGDNTEEH